MFKNYMKKSLSSSEFNKIMKDAPENQAYCNAFCQKFMDKDDFYEKKQTVKYVTIKLLKHVR